MKRSISRATLASKQERHLAPLSDRMKLMWLVRLQERLIMNVNDSWPGGRCCRCKHAVLRPGEHLLVNGRFGRVISVGIDVVIRTLLIWRN